MSPLFLFIFSKPALLPKYKAANIPFSLFHTDQSQLPDVRSLAKFSGRRHISTTQWHVVVNGEQLSAAFALS